MIRHLVSARVGMALAAVAALALALPAEAQMRGGRYTGGQQYFPGQQYIPGQQYFPGQYGYQSGYGYPGYNQGYPGGYVQTPGTMYGYPGYYTPNQQFTTPQYGYVQQPYQMNQAGGVTQAMYQPTGNAARLTVKLPANAKLWVENHEMQQTGPVRVMNSPPLQPGQTYHYTLKAQWDDNGKQETQERTVNIQAGADATVDFNQPEGQGGQHATTEPINPPRNQPAPTGTPTTTPPTGHPPTGTPPPPPPATPPS